MPRRTLIDETNRLFWARTNYKPGQRLDMSDPQDRKMAKIWLEIFAEVQGYRDRMTRLARSTYERTRAPLVVVAEEHLGPSHAWEYHERDQFDGQYDWAGRQPDQFAYVAAFDFSRRQDEPLLETFPASRVPPQPADAAEAALASLRDRAKEFARLSRASVVGVARRAETGEWFAPTFRATAEAAAWFARVSEQPTWFTYAAYFDKADPRWPLPAAEAIGQARAPAVAGWYGYGYYG